MVLCYNYYINNLKINYMEIITEFLTLVPVVLGVVQVFKMIGLEPKFLPMLSLVLGITATVSLGALDVISVIQGLVVGLAASGLWSGGKHTIKTVTSIIRK